MSSESESKQADIRRALYERTLSDMLQVWSERGRTALVKFAEQDPARFCQFIAPFLPEEVRSDVIKLIRH